MNNFGKNWEDTGASATETAVSVVWNQWANLGSMARRTSKKGGSRVIDPEALVLASIALQSQERRLTDALHWWAKSGTALMSIQRMKKLAKDAGRPSRTHFCEYALLASEFGHRSWRKYAAQETYLDIPKNQPNDTRFELRGTSSLQLRLRAAFGVGVKADVLCYLISSTQTLVSVSEIRKQLGYTQKAVRDSLKDMNLAGLVSESTGRPALYATNRYAWIELLHPEVGSKTDHPQWAMWSSFLPFLLSAADICTAAVSADLSDFLVNSYARDLVEKYQHAFKYHHVRLPNAVDFPGREYSIAFAQVVSQLSQWIEDGR